MTCARSTRHGLAGGDRRVRPPDTVDAIQEARRLGHETDRIGHARQLAGWLPGDRWTWYSTSARGFTARREAQVPAIPSRLPTRFRSLVLAVSLERRHQDAA